MAYICSSCSRSYKRKSSLDKHHVLCAFNHTRKRDGGVMCEMDSDDKEFENSLSIKDLYSVIVDLSLKYDKLQADYDVLSKWVKQKKRKINIIDWLNEKCKAECVWDKWLDEVIITDKH